METIIQDDVAQATLGAPEDGVEWRFEKPPGVTTRLDCAPQTQCREDGEYFRFSWVEGLAPGGPLADSVVRAASAPVVVQAADEVRLAGFCEMEGAVQREMLRLPDGYGLPMKTIEALQLLSNEDRRADWSLEQLHVLAWSLANGSQVDLGPCEDLAGAVDKAIALEDGGGEGYRVLVSMAGAQQEAIDSPSLEGAVELASVQGSAPINIQTGLTLFWQEGPVVHDLNCPGKYVMGEVVDAQGAPTAGVRLRITDPWGNVAETASKNGAQDFGRFDFPIYADGAHEYMLMVIDESGNPLSQPIIVQHGMDAGSQTPCHFVRIRAY